MKINEKATRGTAKETACNPDYYYHNSTIFFRLRLIITSRLQLPQLKDKQQYSQTISDIGAFYRDSAQAGDVYREEEAE